MPLAVGEPQRTLVVAAGGLVVIGGHGALQKIRAGVAGGVLSPNAAWGASPKIRAEAAGAVLAP